MFSLKLVRMEAEFMSDESGKIWFTYAYKILTTKIELANIDEDLYLASVQLLSKEDPRKEIELVIDDKVMEGVTNKTM